MGACTRGVCWACKYFCSQSPQSGTDSLQMHAQPTPVNPYDKVLMAFIRLFFPIWFAYMLIMVAFRIGVKKKRDK